MYSNQYDVRVRRSLPSEHHLFFFFFFNPPVKLKSHLANFFSFPETNWKFLLKACVASCCSASPGYVYMYRLQTRQNKQMCDILSRKVWTSGSTRIIFSELWRFYLLSRHSFWAHFISVVSVPQIITVVTVHLGESGADLRAASLVKVESVPQRFYVYRSGIRGVAVNAAAENNACFKQKLFQYVRKFEF